MLALCLAALISSGCASLGIRDRDKAIQDDLQPEFSDEILINDVAQGHFSFVGNPETSHLVRMGDDVFVTYMTGYTGWDESGVNTPDPRVFIRRYDVASDSFDPAIPVFDVVQAENGYHDEPTLLRDGLGQLHALFGWDGQKAASFNTWTTPPRYRLLPSYWEPGRWSAESGLPSRVFNDFGGTHPGCAAPPYPRRCGALSHDVSGAYDGRSRVTHVVGEGAGFPGIDGIENTGLGRMYYRILPDGVWDGPYLLVKADSHQPPGNMGGGNVFTKGDIRLGKEKKGARSVHLAWTIRNTVSQAEHRFLYNVYYARSDDGGDTWKSIDGGASTTLPDPIVYNDPAYLVIESDLLQNDSRIFQLDSRNRPIFFYSNYVEGTGTIKFGHVDNQPNNLGGPLDPVPDYQLYYKRWTGRSWREGIVSSDRYNDARFQAAVDRSDRIWVFWSQPPRYNVSNDWGRTWSGWTRLGPSDGARLDVYPDPVDPDNFFLTFIVRSNLPDPSTNPTPAEIREAIEKRKLVLMRMKLTNGP